MRNPFDRRPPGRPQEDPNLKYGEHFRDMAATICADRCSVARAAAAVSRNLKGVGPDRLARLYRQHRRDHEVKQMERRLPDIAKWWADLRRAEEFVSGDERLQWIARDIVRGYPGTVPLHIWNPAELEELLARAEILDPGLYPKPGSNFPIVFR